MHYRHLWLFLGAFYTLLLIIVSLIRVPDIEMPVSFADKVIHFLMYFILVGWFVQLYKTAIQRIMILLFAILLGLGIEYLQGMTSYRSFEMVDALANSLGAATAFVLAATRFDELLSWMDGRVYRLLGG